MRSHHWIVMSVILFFAFGYAAWILIAAMLVIMSGENILRFALYLRGPLPQQIPQRGTQVISTPGMPTGYVPPSATLALRAPR